MTPSPLRTAGCRTLVATLIAAALALPASAATLRFDNTQVDLLTPDFSNVVDFSFVIEIADALIAGQSYLNPRIIGIDYTVEGALACDIPRPGGTARRPCADTPSGFRAFALNRPEADGERFSGQEFYDNGGLLSFAILPSADLSDGLQLDEVDGRIVLDAREVNTGRYHPPILLLLANGTGLLQNSRNGGPASTATNPATGETVDVQPGEEYITFIGDVDGTPLSGINDPSLLTLATAEESAAAVVPLPSSVWLLGAALVGLVLASPRRKAWG